MNRSTAGNLPGAVLLLLVIVPLGLLASLLESVSGGGAERALLREYGRLYAEMIGMPRPPVLMREGAVTESLGRFQTRAAGAQYRGCLVVFEGPGYRAPMRVALAFDAQTLRGIRVLEHAESSGYGASLLERAQWLGQFVGLPADGGVEVFASTREGGRIDAVSGATITSEGLINIVLNASTGAVDCAREAD